MESDRVCEVHGSSYSHSSMRVLGRDGSSNCSSQDFRGKLKEPGLCSALGPTSKFKPSYPLCDIVVRWIHRKKTNLRAPGLFPKTHIKKSPKTMALICEDKSWPLKLISHERCRKLSADWAAFTRETSMKAGDVYVHAY